MFQNDAAIARNPANAHPPDTGIPLGTELSKVRKSSYLVLLLVILFLSGVFNKAPGALAAIDLTNVVGQFGSLVEPGERTEVDHAPNFRGIGGTGARDAWLYTLWYMPTVMVALGAVRICEYYDGMRAAQNLLNPILRPLLGIPGSASLSLAVSLTSADGGAEMTKRLQEAGYLSEAERLISLSFQVPCPATMSVYFSLGAAMIPFITEVPIVLPLGVILLMKIVGANLCRLYVHRFAGRDGI